jgi:hypothetical protein
VAKTGLQKRQCRSGVIPKVERGLHHRLTDFGKGREVNHGVEGLLLE